MNKKFVQYEHHDGRRWVRADMKDKNKEYSICSFCNKFKPNSRFNCIISRSLYSFCSRNDVMAVMWDCPIFEEKDEN